MTLDEFSEQFDVLYNNITSNQAPGLSEYEKSFFLTKSQKETIKNHYTASSGGNNLKLGFDDSAKRQADFSLLMKVGKCEKADVNNQIDPRSIVFKLPSDLFIVVNESVVASGIIKQVVPIRFDEYTTYMMKPFKRPFKNQVWRLINSGSNGDSVTRYAELIFSPEVTGRDPLEYNVRYIKTPYPIIVGDLEEQTIDGKTYKNDAVLDTDPILHDEILQRAVEIAKLSWTQLGQDNTQSIIASGQRSE